MSVFTEVLYDLYLFAIKYRCGFVKEKKTNEPPALWSPIAPPAIISPIAPPAIITSLTKHIGQDTGYVYAPQAYMHVLPTRIFDGILAKLAYGTPFPIIRSQGKWLDIEYHELRGWIHFDDVTRDESLVEPRFNIGEIYGVNHGETVKLRNSIEDQFHAVPFEIPLQDVEYVSYKLQKTNRTINWPIERPRVAGTWQRLLKGVVGVHLGIVPKKDAIMEYINVDNTGHVAYIEAVYPDESLFISEIGYMEEGRYHERTLTKDEWIEFRPVFIDVA